MTTEGLGVSCVQRILDYTDLLVPRFNRDDKIPITDGFIDVYSRPGERNEDWDGRIDVQIKASLCQAGFPTDVRFRLTRVELTNHQKNGGVLLLLVLINKQTRQEKPYYLILDRFAIASWMGKIKPKKKSVEVPLTALPEDVADVDRVMRLALQMMKHRTSVPVTPDLFERAKSLRIFALNDLDLRRPQRLSRDDTAFSAELVFGENSTIQLDGDLSIIPSTYTERELPVDVGVGDLRFAHATTRRIDTGSDSDVEVAEIKPCLGIVFTFTKTPDNVTVKVDLAVPQSLADRKRAVELFLSLAHGGILKLDDRQLGNQLVIREPIAELHALEQMYADLIAYAELCECLGIDESLVDMERASASDLHGMKVLRACMVDDMEHEDKAGHAGQFSIQVAQRQIIFLSLPGSDAVHWRFGSPFGGTEYGQLRFSNDDDPDDTYPITAYDLLSVEQVRTTLNLRLDAVVDAYAALNERRALAQANDFTLKLLLASDLEENPRRRAALLEGARRLSEWLLKHEEETEPYQVNFWQTMHRTGELTDQMRSEIRAMRRRSAKLEDESFARQLQLSCALLLGDSAEIEDLIAELSDGERQTFEEWPIWHLRMEASSQDET